MLNKRTYNIEHQELNQRFKNIDYSKIPRSNAKPNKITIAAINGPSYRIG